jgi:6-phosphogluconolactonase
VPGSLSTVEVYPTREVLMQAAAERFVVAARAAVRASGRFAVALAGGATPRGLYALLASGALAARVEWSRVQVFFGDERCVPPDDPASNYRMARESLLDRVALPAANVCRIRGEDDPAEAAARYEEELRRAFATPDGPPREAPGSRFDLVLLGMGANGHTASLFPSSKAVGERRRWAVAERVEAVGWRVTLTPVVINAAAEVAFLVCGPEKAATLRRVLEGPRDPRALPAQAVEPRSGRLVWLLDAEAAARLARR